MTNEKSLKAAVVLGSNVSVILSFMLLTFLMWVPGPFTPLPPVMVSRSFTTLILSSNHTRRRQERGDRALRDEVTREWRKREA